MTIDIHFCNLDTFSIHHKIVQIFCSLNFLYGIIANLIETTHTHYEKLPSISRFQRLEITIFFLLCLSTLRRSKLDAFDHRKMIMMNKHKMVLTTQDTKNKSNFIIWIEWKSLFSVTQKCKFEFSFLVSLKIKRSQERSSNSHNEAIKCHLFH